MLYSLSVINYDQRGPLAKVSNYNQNSTLKMLPVDLYETFQTQFSCLCLVAVPVVEKSLLSPGMVPSPHFQVFVRSVS